MYGSLSIYHFVHKPLNEPILVSMRHLKVNTHPHIHFLQLKAPHKWSEPQLAGQILGLQTTDHVSVEVIETGKVLTCARQVYDQGHAPIRRCFSGPTVIRRRGSP